MAGREALRRCSQRVQSLEDSCLLFRPESLSRKYAAFCCHHVQYIWIRPEAPHVRGLAEQLSASVCDPEQMSRFVSNVSCDFSTRVSPVKHRNDSSMVNGTIFEVKAD
nr:hypothetical protein CFP56_00681 [Quercus suber]POE47352.1 hypothetical protein CFP56_00683 [Quercus suber]